MAFAFMTLYKAKHRLFQWSINSIYWAATKWSTRFVGTMPMLMEATGVGESEYYGWLRGVRSEISPSRDVSSGGLRCLFDGYKTNF